MNAMRENLAPKERCACDSVDCARAHPQSGHHLTPHLAYEKQRIICERNAVCVVVLAYPAKVHPGPPFDMSPPAPRYVRLAMCSQCAAFWVKNDRNDGVVATYQVQPKAEVAR